MVGIKFVIAFIKPFHEANKEKLLSYSSRTKIKKSRGNLQLGSVQVSYKHVRGRGGRTEMLILLMWLGAVGV